GSARSFLVEVLRPGVAVGGGLLHGEIPLLLDPLVFILEFGLDALQFLGVSRGRLFEANGVQAAGAAESACQGGGPRSGLTLSNGTQDQAGDNARGNGQSRGLIGERVDSEMLQQWDEGNLSQDEDNSQPGIPENGRNQQGAKAPQAFLGL